MGDFNEIAKKLIEFHFIPIQSRNGRTFSRNSGSRWIPGDCNPSAQSDPSSSCCDTANLLKEQQTMLSSLRTMGIKPTDHRLW
jgi:hypothetical protein